MHLKVDLCHFNGGFLRGLGGFVLLMCKLMVHVIIIDVLGLVKSDG